MRPLTSRASFLPRPETRIAQGPFRQNQARVFPALRKPGFTVVIWHMNWPTSSTIFALRSPSIESRWVWTRASPVRLCVSVSPQNCATATPVPIHDCQAAQEKRTAARLVAGQRRPDLQLAQKITNTRRHIYKYA